MGRPALVALAAEIFLDEHLDRTADAVGGPLGHDLFGEIGQLVGPARDLPGVRYKVIRGSLDTQGVRNRKQARSRYGAKKEKS